MLFHLACWQILLLKPSRRDLLSKSGKWFPSILWEYLQPPHCCPLTPARGDALRVGRAQSSPLPWGFTAAELMMLDTKSHFVMTQGQVERELGIILQRGSASVTVKRGVIGLKPQQHSDGYFWTDWWEYFFQFFATLHILTYYLEYALNSAMKMRAISQITPGYSAFVFMGIIPCRASK